MNEATARRIVWLAAIQEVPGARDALPATPPTAGATDGEWREAFAGAARRQPGLESMDRDCEIPGWLAIALLLLAFLSGVLTETLSAGGRVNLIAFPLLALLMWNLGVYVRLFFGPAPELDPHGATGFRSWLADRCEAWLGAGAGASEDPWNRVRRVFLQRWFNHARPLLQSRVALALHLSAAAAMVGLVAGMYWRGLGFEYRAGWSSTFLNGESLRALLGIVLGPAAWVSGLGLPDAAALDRLAWSRNPEGENAARWIHLYAVTAALYVGLPRLLLALAAAGRVRRLRQDFPLDPAALGFASVAAGASIHRARRVSVLPFNLDLSPKDREVLRLFAAGEAGGPVQLDVQERIGYADVEEVLAAFQPDADTHAHALVFNLSTTPEAEVQGELIAGLRDRVERLVVYLDGAAFAGRFRDTPDFAERLMNRRAAWTRFLDTHGLKPVFLRADP